MDALEDHGPKQGLLTLPLYEARWCLFRHLCRREIRKRLKEDKVGKYLDRVLKTCINWKDLKRLLFIEPYKSHKAFKSVIYQLQAKARDSNSKWLQRVNPDNEGVWKRSDWQYYKSFFLKRRYCRRRSARLADYERDCQRNRHNWTDYYYIAADHRQDIET